MKLIVKIYIALLLSLISCETKKGERSPDEGEQITIDVEINGINYSEFSSSGNGSSGDNLLAIQVYEIEDGGNLIPYANGLFKEWQTLSFNGFSKVTYKVEATMVANASECIKITNEIYGKPFESGINSEFKYSDAALAGLSISTAMLNDGVEYELPNIDRFYGRNTQEVDSSDPKVEVLMKRVSFGIKLDGLEEEVITLKLEDAPSLDIMGSEITYFTFQNIISAYNSDESSSPYSESINIEILKDGISVLNENIHFIRNQLAIVTMENDDLSIGFEFEEGFEDDDTNPDDPITTPDDATAYVTKVLDYVPAPGQFVNKMPEYEEGDSQDDMNQKALEAICDKGRGAITLGGYGGYIVVGFDHTIVNVNGKRDFRIKGNAFYADFNSGEDEPEGGSCEPAIIMVAYDSNKNGIPDQNEWYEIAGSSHVSPKNEPWYEIAEQNGNDLNFYRDFEINYTRPTSEPSSENYSTYIPWSDNKGNSGYISKNEFNTNEYYPQWITEDLKFSGSRLPQNGVNRGSTDSPYHVLYKFSYGYADNEKDEKDDSAIDISWAVDSEGKSVSLPGVDFIKIYSGVNQVNGWLGECSPEITSVEDLHILGIDIATH